MKRQSAGAVNSGSAIKVIQDVLGHADVSTTLNIYADATKELKKSEFESLEIKLKNGL